MMAHALTEQIHIHVPVLEDSVEATVRTRQIIVPLKRVLVTLVTIV